ncbi:MAG: addiction module protein [bacterium]
MASRVFPLDALSVEERLDLIGQRWNSRDPAIAAPMTEEFAAELDHREADADAEPDAGEPWPEIHAALRRQLH